MAERKTCPQCGAGFVPAASPLGVCPACLLKLGASDSGFSTAEPSAAIAQSTGTIAVPPARSRPRARGVVAWLVAGAIVTAGTWALIRLRESPVRSAPLAGVVRFDLAPPDGTTLVDDPEFAVSPDGTRIVLTARGADSEQRLWLRALQSMAWTQLAGTDDARLPFWSPDSRHIGFFAEGRLKSIDPASGLVLTLCDAPAARGGSWNSQNVIVFAPRATGPLSQVPATGGTPRALGATDRARGVTAHGWPHFLPDGKRFLFVGSAPGSTAEAAGLYVGQFDGQSWQIVAGAGPAAYAQGVLVAQRGSALTALPFDAVRAKPAGDAVPIAGADRVGHGSLPGFSLSAAGMLVHAVDEPRSTSLGWIDRNGHVHGPIGEPADYDDFSLAPDGRSLAVTRYDTRDDSWSIWIYDFAREMSSRLTAGRSRDRSPLWSPDGRLIVFASSLDGVETLQAVESGGASREPLVSRSPEAKRPLSWSPDGRQLLYATTTPETGSDIWILTFGGKEAPQALLRGPANESDARFSPDGRSVAYVSDESGRDEVYVQRFPLSEGRVQVSQAGGSRPRWRGDGRELFFISRDRRLMAVDIRAGESMTAGRALSLADMRQSDRYEVAPDGQRFLVRFPADRSGRDRLQVVLNWARELPSGR